MSDRAAPAVARRRRERPYCRVLPGLVCCATAATAPWSALATDILGVLPGAFDQPQVNFVIRPAAGVDPYTAEDVFSGKGFNIAAYLDTGASGVLLDGDLADALQHPTVGVGLPRMSSNSKPVYFEDVGAVGSDRFTVTQPISISVAPNHPNSDALIQAGEAQYNLDNSFANVDLGVYNHTANGVRAQVSAPSDPTNPGAISGVNLVGMPAMKGKVVVLDSRPPNRLQFDTMRVYLYQPGTPARPATSDTDPGIPTTTRTIKLSYANFDSFTRTGTVDAGGNLTPFTGAELAANQPTLVHNPFVGPNPLNPAGDTTPPIKLTFGTHSASGSFLLDTGAASTMISSNLAAQLAVRYVDGTRGTNNPLLETFDPAHPANPGTQIADQFQQTIGGVGGSATIAGFFLGSLLVRTTQGNAANDNDPKHFRFIDAPVLVNDIKLNNSLTLDGIFGMNLLTVSVLTQNQDIGGGQIVPVPVALAPGAFDFIVFDEPNGTLSVRPRLNGDANRDGKVDFQDLVAVAQHYDTSDSSTSWETGDFNGDGTVDFKDLVTIAQHYDSIDLFNSDVIELPNFAFGLGLQAAAAAPEPTGLMLVAPLAAGVCLRRQRRNSPDRRFPTAGAAS